MKLWRIIQNVNTGYDSYDSAVVVAETEEEARKIHPGARDPYGRAIFPTPESWEKCDDWANYPSQVQAIWIGEAAPGLAAGEVVCASFNAG